MFNIYIYTYPICTFISILLMSKQTLLLSSCLTEGKFLCTVNWVNILPYIFSLRWTYLWITFLIRDDKWSCSWPISWSKKCPSTILKMPIPSCLRTAVWIFRSSIFSVLMLVLLSITLLLKTTSVALTIFSIAGDGSTNPPCCFQHVNFAYTGYDSTVNAVGSIGSRNNSFLHFLQLIFCMRFRIINPAM